MDTVDTAVHPVVNVSVTFHSLDVLYLETSFISRVATCRNTSQHGQSCITDGLISQEDEAMEAKKDKMGAEEHVGS